jgi:hypothetical protein
MSFIQNAIHGNGLAIISGSGGYAASSNDGTSWTDISSSVNLSAAKIGAFGNGTFILGGSETYAYSTNGTTWTNATWPFQSTREVAFGNGVFVSAGYQNLASSTDGISWTTRKTTTEGTFSKVSYGANIFWTSQELSGNQVRIWASSDGINWFSQILLTSQFDVYALMDNNSNRLVAVSQLGEVKFMSYTASGGGEPQTLILTPTQVENLS